MDPDAVVRIPHSTPTSYTALPVCVFSLPMLTGMSYPSGETTLHEACRLHGASSAMLPDNAMIG